MNFQYYLLFAIHRCPFIWAVGAKKHVVSFGTLEYIASENLKNACAADSKRYALNRVLSTHYGARQIGVFIHFFN